MKGLAPYYFPLFEQQLEQYDLPLEFKYLAIVESALNPKARSHSGATGLWQFMYPTGKQYGLEVTSYVDERQDPLKSTMAACEYFIKLYDLFGDWNLVLVAYNGGPGYIQRKIASVGTSDFWELYPHLRKETRNYIPTFIAVNYVMNYASEHGINTENPSINLSKTDTITLKNQVELKTLTELLCINSETIHYLNPSYKKEGYPKDAVLVFPKDAVNDFKLNEYANYTFIDAVDKKEILIDEERIIYRVHKGDYLGRIAKAHNVHIFEIREWNNLKSSNLDIGDKLVIYVKKGVETASVELGPNKNEYTIQKGDTLWGIAQKYDGLSVWKIKSLNNLDSDNLKPGTKIILPSS
jgi:membrane-bound lytic murein transglycosylase D